MEAISKDELKRKSDEGLSLLALAQHFHRSQTTIRYWIKTYEIERKSLRPRRNWSCETCGKSVLPKRLFCGRGCQDEYRVGRWKNDDHPGGGQYGIAPFVRRYLYRVRGEKCEKCGWSEVHPMSDRVPLEVHHIDADCMNNREENLQVLCPNCHSLTPSYRRLNKNSGRTKRSQAMVAKENHNL